MPPAPRLSIGRALASSAWPALLAVLLLVAGARWWLPETIDGPIAEGGWTRRSRAAFAPSGFHPTELDPATGRSFSWSREESTIEIPGLRRSRAHRVTLSVRGVRPPDRPPADVQLLVDGQSRSTVAVPNEASEVTFEIPRAGERGATVTLRVANPFVPGGADPRALGIIVDRVGIAPVNGPFVPSGHAIAMLAAAVFMAALAMWLCGLRGVPGAIVSAALAIGYVWLLLQDAAFLGAYVDLFVNTAAICLIAGAGVGLVRMKWPMVGGVAEWGSAAGVILAISTIKLAAFWHPLVIVGDGIFQVHRAQVVHGGQYFFTSITPKPFFEFPYPVALYVFALPFWNWFPSELDLLRLLRTVAIVADGLAGLMLYGAIRRQWNDRVMAFSCAALWPLAMAPLQALSNANLTNLFGQSVFGAALAAVAWMAAGSSISIAGLVGAGGLLTIAFLSHFGTVPVGLATIGAAAVMLTVLGAGHVRRVGFSVVAVSLAAVLAAWMLYYSHPAFQEVYGRTWAAVAAPESDNSSKIVAAPAVKLQRWWSGTGDDYGRPGLAVLFASAVGVGILIRQRRTGAGLVFLAWVLAWLALSVLGVMTPLTLRANLAAAPAFIALSAIAIGGIASHSRAGRGIALAIAALIAWDGLRIMTASLQLATGN